MAALLLLGRYPDLVHRASLWVPIYDLAMLYGHTSNQSLRSDMVDVLGSPPEGPDDPRYLARSPRSCLRSFNGRATVFMNVGANDMETPKQHGIDAYSAMLSSAPGSDVRLIEWAGMGHEFRCGEAVKQLVLE